MGKTRDRLQISLPATRAELNRRVQTIAQGLRERGLTVKIAQKILLRAVAGANNLERRTDTRESREKAKRALMKAAAALKEIVEPVYHEDTIRRAPKLLLMGDGRLVPVVPSKKARALALKLPPFPKAGPGELSDMLIQTLSYLDQAPRMGRREDVSERLKFIVGSLAGSLCALRINRRPSLIKILIDRVILNEAQRSDGLAVENSLKLSRFMKIYYSLPPALVSYPH